jgi:hypothetical protein
VAGFVRRKERLEALKNAGGYTVQFSYDEADMKAMRKLTAEYPVKLRKKIIRAAIVRWTKRVEGRARAAAYHNAHRTKANIFQKVRVYKRAVWGAVGVRTGRVAPGQELKGRYGDQLPGWRSHLYEVGWRPYPKLWDNDREKRKGKGRGWRRGLRKRFANTTRIYRLEYLSKGYRSERGNLRGALAMEIGLYNRKLNRQAELARKRAERASKKILSNLRTMNKSERAFARSERRRLT